MHAAAAGLVLLAAGCADDVDAPPPPSHLDAPASVERGRALFAAHCAICHGEHADGHGVRSFGLSSRPRDFTQPGWKDQLPPKTLFATIRDGKQGTSMPAWALEEDQIWDLVSYLRSVPERGP